MKRFIDVLFSIIGLVLLSPILLVLSFIIRSDGGPALFRQVRVGLHGKEFEIFKFRSMIINAEQLGGYSTQSNDLRITNIGKIIRKTSLDELPQLFNVLKGDMSLVGPRPNVPAQREEYDKLQWEKRNSVLPGITGLAQATLRSKATWQERFELDIEYVNKSSLHYDFYIILLTFKQVFFKGGN
ncbi:sugar transferase [Vibrio nereis]|uniref:sugar transferase n=1 Tax=Vibrio nereis TaxID=693 RepID=UPI0006A94C91|nr:sugar transferase [Vibrio nereis]